MSCELSNTRVHFTVSGIKVIPFSLDIRRARHEDNQFDHVQAKLTKAAGEHIIDNHVDREPVEILIGENEDKLYRGWYTTDGVTLGQEQSTLEIADPRKILRTGAIDKEWGSITLGNVVNYIFERRQDPHNVFTSIEITSPGVDTSMLQHGDLEIFGIGGGFDVAADTGNHGIENFIRETVPMLEGDGNFDFREDSPYSALAEVADIWETEFWVDQDGTLIIGHPDLTANVFGCGRGPNNWHISEWNLPENPTPLKAVIVKGKMDQKGGKDRNLEEAWNIITNKKKFQTRAAAGFLDDNSLSETIVLNGKKETTDPEVLKRMARGAFLTQHTRNNRGSIVVNALVENEIDPGQYAGVDIGDKIVVNNIDAECDILQEGVYDIHSIQHDINGEDGWKITLEVNKAITNAENFKDRFWYFDPTDPLMTQDQQLFDQNPKELNP